MSERTLGERLKSSRHELGRDAYSIATQMDVLHDQVLMWESDALVPSAEQLLALARVYSVDPYWLLQGEPTPRRSGAPVVAIAAPVWLNGLKRDLEELGAAARSGAEVDRRVEILRIAVQHCRYVDGDPVEKAREFERYVTGIATGAEGSDAR